MNIWIIDRRKLHWCDMTVMGNLCEFVVTMTFNMQNFFFLLKQLLQREIQYDSIYLIQPYIIQYDIDQDYESSHAFLMIIINFVGVISFASYHTYIVV